MTRLSLARSVPIAAAFVVLGFLLSAAAAPPEGTTVRGGNIEKQRDFLRGRHNENHAPPAGAGYDLSHKVDFQVGATKLHEGDNITIDEVIGTSDKIEKGNIYLVKGTYRLLSQDSARLSAYVTSDRKSSAQSVPSQKTQTIVIEKGKGQFSLIFYMWDDGWPHLSYYPAKGGSSFSAVYFGTGDCLLKRGWWEKDDAAAAAGEK